MNRNKSNTRALRPLLGKSSDRTNRLPDVAAAAIVVPAEIARIEAEAPRVAGTARIRRRGPVIAERAGAVEVGAVTVAGSRKEDAL